MRHQLVSSVAASLLLAACSGGGDNADAQSAGARSKYEQTWSKAYKDTTCDEWLTQMSSQQQFAAAADMLTGARNKGDGGSGLPPDALISDFQAGVTNVCVIPTMTLTDAAVGLYLTDRDRYKP